MRGLAKMPLSYEKPIEPIRHFSCNNARVELLPAQPYEARYVAGTNGIGFAFDIQHGIHAFDSDRPCVFCTRPNSMAFVPKGCNVYSRSSAGGEYLILSLYQDEGMQLSKIERFSDVIIPSAVAVAHRLRSYLLSKLEDPLIVEKEVYALLEQIVSQSPLAFSQNVAERWMTRKRLRIIQEMVEDRLGQSLSVNDLAQELGLSVGFFIRAFKAATARSPHSYIMDRRLALARKMLLSSKFSLSEIALATGFSSHAHLTATFQARLGISPAFFRKMTAEN